MRAFDDEAWDYLPKIQTIYQEDPKLINFQPRIESVEGKDHDDIYVENL